MKIDEQKFVRFGMVQNFEDDQEFMIVGQELQKSLKMVRIHINDRKSHEITEIDEKTIFSKRILSLKIQRSKLQNVLDLCMDKFDHQNSEVNDPKNDHHHNLSTNLYWIEFDELDHLSVLIDFQYQKMIYKSKNNNIECIEKMYEFKKCKELKQFAQEETKLKIAKDKKGYMNLIAKQMDFIGPDSVLHASSLYRWRQFISKTI